MLMTKTTLSKKKIKILFTNVPLPKHEVKKKNSPFIK